MQPYKLTTLAKRGEPEVEFWILWNFDIVRKSVKLLVYKLKLS